ncbi:MAG: sulfopyruvate decarboxylase subunit alpha [Nitrospinota bacterium]|nr:sulfopyruvate decarboxylase subunit alpha [Nitrospinota bacterium]MDH5678322.1 sulfopyruvate decarboxylase subunit alpha [Nitrospinota bacterium]MDH5757603.1 sulfopyruvate decarboxylase subunit alpha [Nitrospinota bacterium]
MTPEERTIQALKKAETGMAAVLPCDRNKNLYQAMFSHFNCVEISREEEGVGLCAGAALAGVRPVMLIQNSGLGNMVNAIASLTQHYSFPLPILMSWRGKASETIEAQRWMGEYTPRIMDAMEIPYHEIHTSDAIKTLEDTLSGVFEKNEIRGYLFEPEVWKGSDFNPPPFPVGKRNIHLPPFEGRLPKPKATRYEFLKAAAKAMEGKMVVGNIGAPSKELCDVMDQPSNFYMLGSMGMATPIALGAALNSNKTVISIDGDGSALMNPSTLATVARTAPGNLLIFLIDNGSYGSTGDQPTAASQTADLAQVARGFGIDWILRTADPEEAAEAVAGFDGDGPLLLHARALPGSASVPNITKSPADIRRDVSDFLQS